MRCRNPVSPYIMEEKNRESEDKMVMNEETKKDSSGVQAVLTTLDVDRLGVARIEDMEGTDMAKAVLDLLPSCRSIVVLGMEIYAEFLDLTTPERITGAPKMNDMLEKHKDHLRGQLRRAAYSIARASREAGLKALPLPGDGPSVDTRFLKGIISYKHAAEAAGLGQIGMSGLLITRECGPRVLLNLCLTEAELTSTAREDTEACQYCNVCVLKCPAKAIGYPKRDEGEKCVINKFACSQYVVNAEGCSECMRVCPVASPKYNQ